VFSSCWRVDGSCAKHLTVESYTVVMLLTLLLIIIISIPAPPHSFISILFLQILLTIASLFFLRTDYMDSLDCLLTLLHICVFYCSVFLFPTFYLSVPCGRLSGLMLALSAR